jgi:hypothetical protein
MRKPGFVIPLTAVLLTAILTAGQTAPVAAPAPDAAQDAPVFKSDLSLVKADAEVLDGERRLLGGFRNEDFRILDNGAPRSSRARTSFTFLKEKCRWTWCCSSTSAVAWLPSCARLPHPRMPRSRN